eukprot:scaffold64_cov338-Pavlova_lutheri.AAC.27
MAVAPANAAKRDPCSTRSSMGPRITSTVAFRRGSSRRFRVGNGVGASACLRFIRHESTWNSNPVLSSPPPVPFLSTLPPPPRDGMKPSMA